MQNIFLVDSIFVFLFAVLFQISEGIGWLGFIEKSQHVNFYISVFAMEIFYPYQFQNRPHTNSYSNSLAIVPTNIEMWYKMS